MLAKRVAQIPEGDSWIFEPKWDGFRALIFRDNSEILIQSRDGKSLNRYFPELLDTLRKALPERCVLDGEIVIATGAGLDFDALQLRIHPAASRVKLLSQQTPASVVFFDLLCEGEEDLSSEPFVTRRKRLEALLSSAAPPIHITPATRDHSVAADWFRRFEGAGLDGVMAKPATGAYEPAKRVMLKIKHERDCDCVVAGFRWHKDAEGTGLDRCCLGCSTNGAPYNTSAYVQALPWRNAARSSNISPGIARMLSTTIPGQAGLKMLGRTALVVCPEDKADGARVKICPGSRFVLNLS